MKKLIYILLFLPLLVTAQTTTENFIKTTTYKVPETDSSLLNSVHQDSVSTSITYFDGLGRAKQSIAVRVGGQRQDIITPIIYDEFGRQVREYLPYSRAYSNQANSLVYAPSLIPDSNGNILPIHTQYRDRYSEDFTGMTLADVNPYSEKHLESSPLNRVFEQAAPGKDWKLDKNLDTDHSIKFEYNTNTLDEVRKYYVTTSEVKVSDESSVITYVPTLEGGTDYYSAGELYKTITKDENWYPTQTNPKDHTTEEFKNKQGQVVLKRTYNNDIAHDTFYVYDDFGNLTYVIPPKAEGNTDKPDATELSELCYQYKYDNRNRLVEKKIPGKGWEYIVYNTLDQPILTQDSGLEGQWLFTKYDAFGRVAYTGIFTFNTIDREGFQNSANNPAYTQYENRSATAQTFDGTPVFYENTAIPNSASVMKLFTINYYDTYENVLPSSLSNTVTTSYGITSTLNTKGLSTVTKVKVLDTDDWITTVTYYDQKARPIYVYSKNDFLKTIDIVESKLDFTGKVLETKTYHKRIDNDGDVIEDITIIDKFDYDHADRLIKQTQKINDATLDEVIVENSYDDLGQLVSKNVGGKTNQNRLQTIDYTYNVRGWLKKINDPSILGKDLFGFQINYNNSELSGSTALFNGNISEVLWKTDNDKKAFSNSLIDQRGYSYKYDGLNRLREGQFFYKKTDSYVERNFYTLRNVSYDKNGNLQSLIRSGTTHNAIDNLIYTYDSGNKLIAVKDRSDFDDESIPHFIDGHTGTDYSYDDNGNMVKDLNKGIGTTSANGITYNHLNLPTKVTINKDNHDGEIKYFYDATGVKLRKIVDKNNIENGTTITDYAGNYIYENADLKFFNHPEGYVEPNNNNGFNYIYQYKDHLGNVRLSYKALSESNSVVDIEEDYETNTGGWSKPSVTIPSYIDNVNGKLKLYFENKGQQTKRDITINPDLPVHIEFDFTKGTMEGTFLFVKEKIDGVWESNANRDVFNLVDGKFQADLFLTGNVIKLILEKKNGSDNGTPTTAYIDNFKISQNNLQIVEESNYYPFGLKHKGYNNVTSPNGNSVAQKFGFGGKELNEELGIEWHDFGARNYDAALGRWMNIDPLADKNYSWTPFRYGYNNPIKFVDPDGKYERDGHYWTVYLAATLSGHQSPASIAYWAEEPDHIMSHSGDIIRATKTWINPRWQVDIHALTGGNAENERAFSKHMYHNYWEYDEGNYNWSRMAIQLQGYALHRLGDSYAHSKSDGTMYKTGIGHGLKGHSPDEIAKRPELYLEYVKDLIGTLGGSGVDMFTFNYIAENKGDTEENSAILETEIRIREGVSNFSVKGNQSKSINKYMSARNKKTKTNKKYKTVTSKVDVYKRNDDGEWKKTEETRTFVKFY